MKAELQAAVLILLLLVVTFVLGVEFGGSGLSGASGNFGPPLPSVAGKQTAAIPPPEFVVRAEGINPQDLYASSQLQTIPPGLLVPLVGLHITLLTQGRTSAFRRLPALSLMTNASGTASAALPPGNYEVTMFGSTFSLDTAVTLINNSTTTLSVQLRPSYRSVAVLRVVSPDTASGVESGSRLYGLIINATPPTPGPSELVGYGSGSSAGFPFDNATGALVSVNATLSGSYPGTTGYWATFYPAATYPTYPTVGVMLFQFEPLAEVNSTAG